MSEFIKIPTKIDDRGMLSAIDGLLPFEIKRVYYVYETILPRGGHAHRYSSTFIIPIAGSVEVILKNKEKALEEQMILSDPTMGLLITPGDWISFKCSPGAFLLCISSHPHNKEDDYIYEA